MTRFYRGWARVSLPGLRRGLTERITLGLLDRIGDPPRLDAAQRSWLLQDFREDLDAQIEDAEERGITERGARELVSTRAIVEWLEEGDFPRAGGIELLEEAVARTPRDPSRQERRRRDAYLAAIGELGGDEEAAARLWRDGVDVPQEADATPVCSSEIDEEPAIVPVSAQEAVETVEEVLPEAVAPSEPGSSETGEEEVDPTYSDPKPNLVAEGTPAESETSVNATGGISLSGVACITPSNITSSVTEAKVVNSDAAVFANTGVEADTVVRPTAAGVMIDQSIRGPESSEFALNIKVREGDELVQLESGAIAVVEPETGANEGEGHADLEMGGSEAPASIEEPTGLANAASQREAGEYELAKAATETAGTVVAVIPEPWILLANEEIIPAHIEIAPVVEEPNEYVVNYHIELPSGEQQAAVYPVQATAIASVLTSEGRCTPLKSPCGQPDLESADQYAVYWGNPNHVVSEDGTKPVAARNPFYMDFGAPNCTNFISQILRAGGEKWMRFGHTGREAWWYRRHTPWIPHESFFFEYADYSETWPLADVLPRFLWQYGYVHIDPVDQPRGWTRGDILAYNGFSEGYGTFDHLNYVVGTVNYGGEREPLISNESEPLGANYGALVWKKVKERIQEEEPQGWERVPLAWKHTEANADEKRHDPANLYGPNGVFHE